MGAVLAEREEDVMVRELAATIRGRKVTTMEPLASGSYTGDGIYKVRFQRERRSQVLKLVGRTGLDMNRKTATRLYRDTVEFFQAQQDLGIRVPESNFSLAKFGSRWVLVELAPYHGASLEQFATGNPKALHAYVQQVLHHVIGPLLDSSHDGRVVSRIGLDPLLRNLCFIDGVPGNIDQVPPKLYRGPNDFTLEIPEPSDPIARHIGFVRHFTLAGLLFSVFMNVVRLHPEAYNDVMAQILRFIASRRRTEILDQLPTVCGTIWLETKEEASKVLADMGHDWFSELRQVACWIASQNGRLKPALEKAFRLTHFTAAYLTPAEFETARTHVQGMLDRI